MTVLPETDFVVQGMTCGGCAGKVARAVEALDGVSETDVDLATGTLTVVGTADADAVTAAVEAAGYRVA